MSKYLDEHLAEILCTIIAVGFIKEQQGNTKFVYEDIADEPDHRKLEQLLHKRCRIDVTFKPATNPYAEPFIIGQTRTVLGVDSVQQIADELMTNINILQTRFRNQVADHTPGHILAVS